MFTRRSRFDGPIGRMRHPLEHRTIPDVRVFLRKIDQYTTLEARDLYRRATALEPAT